MLLSNGNVTVRNALPSDAKQLCTWWNDGAIMAHAGFPNGLGTTEEKVKASLALDTDRNRRLILEVDEKLVGEMNYRDIGADTAEIGIKICETNKQNQGIGQVAIKLLLTALFQDLDFHKVVLDTNTNNIRAQHFYEKLGFRKLRVRENCWQDQLGVWQSAVDYEMCAVDFKHLMKMGHKLNEIRT